MCVADAWMVLFQSCLPYGGLRGVAILRERKRCCQEGLPQPKLSRTLHRVDMHPLLADKCSYDAISHMSEEFLFYAIAAI
jgi:hypothetical protein